MVQKKQQNRSLEHNRIRTKVRVIEKDNKDSKKTPEAWNIIEFGQKTTLHCLSIHSNMVKITGTTETVVATAKPIYNRTAKKSAATG